MRLNTREIDDLTKIKGIPFPRKVAFSQIIVTGPPGSGKTHFVSHLGGWPQEGYLDLALPRWWQHAVLTFRPREVHLGFPFEAFKSGQAVFDKEWMQAPTAVDTSRIHLPPHKEWFFQADWYKRFYFDFLLPSPDAIFKMRSRRAIKGNHPVDLYLQQEQVEKQLKAYEDIALFFHLNGLHVAVRTSYGGEPRAIVSD